MRKNIAILIFDEVEVLDFAGPFEVFAATDELLGGATFNVFTAALLPGTVRARHGLKVVPDHTLEDCPPPHVLVIPGGFGTRALLNRPSLLEWIRVKARKAEIVMSVCTGALVLAKAGLLDGLRVTTHHEQLAALAELAPTATVDPNARFHDNPSPVGAGRLMTAAGISAGIDCSLHAVRQLVGANAAAACAHYMEYHPGA
jgi:transcriptional regulator GlxA family with amidase domain